MQRRKVLYFTRSAGFVHSVVRREGSQLSHSEKVLVDLCRRDGFEIECSQDPRVFEGDVGSYDAIVFYTSGEPISPAGKKRLLDAVAQGKGFVGIHSAAGTFPSGARIDPYIAMLGGEVATRGEQQEASLLISMPKFPLIANLVMAEGLPFTEEWYTFKNYAPDLHPILIQETRYLKGEMYRCPDYPATWARLHGQGRVFYTSLGHREDIWTNPFFQAVLMGGLAWASGRAEFDIQAKGK